MLIAKIVQLKNHKYFKLFVTLALLILLYLSYRIYIWTNTQSTDNAYLDNFGEIAGCVVRRDNTEF